MKTPVVFIFKKTVPLSVVFWQRDFRIKSGHSQRVREREEEGEGEGKREMEREGERERERERQERERREESEGERRVQSLRRRSERSERDPMHA